DLADRVRELLEDQSDFEVLGGSDLSTVLFRFAPPNADRQTCDDLVPIIRRVLFRSGRAAVARTVIAGTPWLKLTLLNPDTGLDDITAVLDLVRATGHGILAGRTLAGGAACARTTSTTSSASASDPSASAWPHCPNRWPTSTPSSSTSAPNSGGIRA